MTTSSTRGRPGTSTASTPSHPATARSMAASSSLAPGTTAPRRRPRRPGPAWPGSTVAGLLSRGCNGRGVGRPPGRVLPALLELGMRPSSWRTSTRLPAFSLLSCSMRLRAAGENASSSVTCSPAGLWVRRPAHASRSYEWFRTDTVSLVDGETRARTAPPLRGLDPGDGVGGDGRALRGGGPRTPRAHLPRRGPSLRARRRRRSRAGFGDAVRGAPRRRAGMAPR